MRRRVNLSECMVKQEVIEPFLKPSLKHPVGHPFDLDEEVYASYIPIPRELTEQIEKSKPKDTIQSLLRLPSRLFAFFVRTTEKWIKAHSSTREPLDIFL